MEYNANAKSPKLSMNECYKGRNILLTGVTGFLGKILFKMIALSSLDIAGVYLLIRPKGSMTAQARLNDEILSSSSFSVLPKEKQIQILQCMNNKIHVIKGDIASPCLGVDTKTYKWLGSHIDMVFHSAALVDYFPTIERANAINLKGTINIAEFIKHSERASLVHLSSCYVYGNKSGVFEEAPLPYESPNGKKICPKKECEHINQEITKIHERTITAIEKEKMLVDWGRERSQSMGWPNTYCYTKAIAEMILGSRYSDISYSIVRPSIIESALSFPCPG